MHNFHDTYQALPMVESSGRTQGFPLPYGNVYSPTVNNTKR